MDGRTYGRTYVWTDGIQHGIEYLCCCSSRGSNSLSVCSNFCYVLITEVCLVRSGKLSSKSWFARNWKKVEMRPSYGRTEIRFKLLFLLWMIILFNSIFSCNSWKTLKINLKFFITHSSQFFSFWFLNASSHIYIRLCPSVGQSVGPLVRWSVNCFFLNAKNKPCSLQ